MDELLLDAILVLVLIVELACALCLIQINIAIKKIGAQTWKDKLMNSVIQAFAGPVMAQLQETAKAALSKKTK